MQAAMSEPCASVPAVAAQPVAGIQQQAGDDGREYRPAASDTDRKASARGAPAEFAHHEGRHHMTPIVTCLTGNRSVSRPTAVPPSAPVVACARSVLTTIIASF